MIITFCAVSTAFAAPIPQTPISLVFDGVKSQKTSLRFLPVKFSRTRDFGSLYLEVRGEWGNLSRKETVVHVLQARATTIKTKSEQWKIWNLGGILPPEDVGPLILRGKDSYPVYYGIEPRKHTSKIMAAAHAGSKIFLELIVRVGSKKGKIILPGFTLASLP